MSMTRSKTPATNKAIGEFERFIPYVGPAITLRQPDTGEQDQSVLNAHALDVLGRPTHVVAFYNPQQMRILLTPANQSEAGSLRVIYYSDRSAFIHLFPLLRKYKIVLPIKEGEARVRMAAHDAGNHSLMVDLSEEPLPLDHRARRKRSEK